MHDNGGPICRKIEVLTMAHRPACQSVSTLLLLRKRAAYLCTPLPVGC